MKILKLILVIATISVFTSVPYSVSEARDCSNPKGFHEKLMCKKFLSNLKLKKSSSGESAASSEPQKKKSGIGGVWQKIKNFGGKNVGEPG